MVDYPLPPSLEDSVLQSVFKAEVRTWAEKIGVEPKSIILRKMTRKWGSCSSKGNLTFDTEILTQPASIRRKIIVHELLHLKYPTHSKIFKAMEKMYLESEDS